MASKRRIKRNSCIGKIRHKTSAGAEAHAKELRDKGERVWPYRCRFCGGWHVGHPSKMQLIAQAQRRSRFKY